MWCRARDIATTYGYWLQDETFDEPVDSLYNSAKFLVVDELGREQDVKNFAQRMHSLLSVRRDNLLVTCFTTNLSLEKVGNVYGAGFYSILHETCFACSAQGPDRRIQ
jgi:DNA replication protein DnaC